MTYNMKFTEKRIKWEASRYTARKKGFTFTVMLHGIGGYHALITNPKLDIRYSTAWDGIRFPTKEDAFEYCEDFNPENLLK